MSEIKIVPPRTNDPIEIARFYRNICNMLNSICNVQETSTSTTVTDIVSDFNDLLDHLRDVAVNDSI